MVVLIEGLNPSFASSGVYPKDSGAQPCAIRIGWLRRELVSADFRASGGLILRLGLGENDHQSKERNSGPQEF